MGLSADISAYLEELSIRAKNLGNNPKFDEITYPRFIERLKEEEYFSTPLRGFSRMGRFWGMPRYREDFRDLKLKYLKRNIARDGFVDLEFENDNQKFSYKIPIYGKSRDIARFDFAKEEGLYIVQRTPIGMRNWKINLEIVVLLDK